jgi:antitoxin HicB
MKEHSYRVRLSKEPAGGYTVTVPTLPGCITCGKDVDEALAMAKEAIELYLECLCANCEPVPDDSCATLAGKPVPADGQALECTLTVESGD